MVSLPHPDERLTVTIYSKPNCPQCDATKRRFNKHGIEYIEIDARDHAETLREMGYSQVPVVVTDSGETWSGYRPDRIRAFALVS